MKRLTLKQLKALLDQYRDCPGIRAGILAEHEARGGESEPDWLFRILGL